MMQRRHLEQPPTLTVAPSCPLKIARLHHHRNRLTDKDDAHDGQQQPLLRLKRNQGQGRAQGQRPKVAHEDLGRVSVVPEESRASAHQCKTESHEVRQARFSQKRHHAVGGKGQGQIPPSEAVEAVRQVDGIRDKDDDQRSDGNKPRANITFTNERNLEFTLVTEAKRRR